MDGRELVSRPPAGEGGQARLLALDRDVPRAVRDLGKNDSVDVQYTVGGEQRSPSYLDIVRHRTVDTRSVSLRPMRIDEILDERRPVFSFEFFPPKTDEGRRTCATTLDELRDDEPDFVSVTYGALRLHARPHDRHRQVDQAGPGDRGDGALHLRRRDASTSCARRSTRSRRPASRTCSRCAATRPRARTSGPPTDGRPALLDRADRAAQRALRLRGRRRVLPRGAHPRRRAREPDLDVPEGEAVTPARRFLITQLFFDNELYFDFVDKARAAGHRRADHPGDHAGHRLRPDQAHHRAVRVARSRTRFERELDAREDDPQAVRTSAWPTRRCSASDLLARGAPGIHFYTLNRSPPRARSSLRCGRAAVDAAPQPV